MSSCSKSSYYASSLFVSISIRQRAYMRNIRDSVIKWYSKVSSR